MRTDAVRRLGAAAALLFLASPCFAKKGLGALLPGGGAAGAEPGGDVLWGFVPVKLLYGVAAMPIAALLAAAIAYHPLRIRALGVKKEEWETPKALIFIAVAGVIVGTLVNIQPSMALALFGFGSFIRFRTQVKNPKETVIIFLAAGIGCLCGLEQFHLALELLV